MGRAKNDKIDIILALLVLSVSYLWFHVTCSAVAGDTIIFLEYLDKMGAWELLKFRMEHETSRVILEGMLFLFLNLPDICFYLANIIMVALSVGLMCIYGKSMGKKCFGEQEPIPFLFLLSVFLFFLYPLEDLTAAGIPGTFINYVWSGSFGLISFIPLALLAGEKRRCGWGIWLLAIVSTVIAANMEQTAVILFAADLVGAVWLWKEGKREWRLALLCGLVLLSLLFHLFGGNVSRYETSVAVYWPEFGQLTWVEKAWNGVITTTNHLLSIPNMIFLSFSLLLALLAVFTPGKRLWWKVPGTLPLVYEGMILLSKVLEKVTGKGWLLWWNAVDDPYTDAAVCPLGVWFPLLCQLIVLLSALIFLWFLADRMLWRCMLLGILALGFSSRVMMGFSPTLFMSHTRTFYYFYLSILIVEIVLCAGLWKRSRRGFMFFYGTTVVVGIMNFVRMVLKVASVM